MNKKKLLTVSILTGLITLIFCLVFFACGDPPEENDVTGVTFDRTSIIIPLDNVDLATFTVQPPTATYQSVIWKSDNTSIVTVNSEGIIKTVAAGSTTVTVTIGKVTANCTVRVEGTPETGTSVKGITLNKSNITLSVGGSENLTATFNPTNSTNKSLCWTSNSIGVAKVDSNGKVTAVATGTATITATSKNKGKTATCTVTVKAASSGPVENPGDTAVESISLNKESLTLSVGGSETLIATLLPANATNKKVEWDSSDESKVTVDSNGKVTAVAITTEKVTITATAGAYEATCKVTVIAGATVPVTGVSVSKPTLTMLIGEDVTLIPLVLPTTASNKDVKWASGNAAVADITPLTGKVLAMTAGTATITVTTEDGKKTGTCEITVKDIGLKDTTTSKPIGAGKYTSKYNETTEETIELSGERFYLYDDTASGANLEYLDFSITKWETATAPGGTYTTAYKITGKITGANKITTGASPNLYGPSTAPGFTETDIKKGTAQGTECWMYIYISSTGKSFVRTPFSKTGKDNGTTLISGRIYTP
jgi:uncharacterized protein YjdB